MPDTPEMKALLKAIEKIDKRIEWREARIKADGDEIRKLVAERDELSWSYRRANMRNRGEDPDTPPEAESEDPWT